MQSAKLAQIVPRDCEKSVKVKRAPANCRDSFEMATQKGLEPSTSAVTGRRSNQLSYCATSPLGCGPRPIIGSPVQTTCSAWWARLGLNQRPPACEADALPLSYAPMAARTDSTLPLRLCLATSTERVEGRRMLEEFKL